MTYRLINAVHFMASRDYPTGLFLILLHFIVVIVIINIVKYSRERK